MLCHNIKVYVLALVQNLHKHDGPDDVLVSYREPDAYHALHRTGGKTGRRNDNRCTKCIQRFDVVTKCK